MHDGLPSLLEKRPPGLGQLDMPLGEHQKRNAHFSFKIAYLTGNTGVRRRSAAREKWSSSATAAKKRR